MKYFKTAKATAEKNKFCVWNGRKGSKAMILDYSLIANNPIFTNAIEDYKRSWQFEDCQTLDFSEFDVCLTFEFTNVFINDNCDASYRIARIVYAESFGDGYVDVGDRSKLDNPYKYSKISVEVK